MKVKTNLVGGIVFIIISTIIWLIIPSQIPMPLIKSAGVNPQLMPKLVVAIIFICGVLLILQSLVLKKENVIEVHFKKEETTAVLVALIMVLYTVLIIKAGFLIGSFVMIIAMLLLFGVKKIMPYVICFALAIGIYYMFVGVFHIGLPGLGGI